MNYKDSGVDIEAGNAFVETLKEKAHSIGGFGGVGSVFGFFVHFQDLSLGFIFGLYYWALSSVFIIGIYQAFMF